MKKLILFASLMLSLMGMEARGEVITYIDHEVTGTGTSTVVTEVERTVNTDDADVIYSTEMPNFLNQESGNVELYNKTVVLNDNHVFNNPVVCWGTVNIILCGDYTLNCWAMINVASGHTLNIYVKKGSTGKLVAKGGSNNAGIGSIANVDAGTINIHGGDINATGGYYSAGIGGGYRRGFDNDAAKGGLTVYGGNVTATGGRDGAGIGSGFEEDQTLDARHHAGYITIYGGTVTALGNIACGIGAAENVFGPKFTMYGGTVTATGNYTGAGIGGYLYDSGTIAIYGGTLYANGGYDGSIIDEICAAGIGGAYNCPGATVNIMGGTVFAKAGTQDNGSGHRAIGAGKGSDDPGVLTIGDAMTVWAGTESNYSGHHFSEDQRVGVCHNSQYAKIAVCDHSGSTITIDDGFTHHHDGCIYCLIASGAEQDHVFNDANKCICGLVSLKDNADNDATITTYNTTSQTITLTGRKFYKDGSWNTLCLPFNLSSFANTPLEGAIVKTLESASFANGTLTLNFSTTNLTSIDAGKPYIVKWESTESTETTENTEIVNPVFNGVTISSTTPTDAVGEAASFHGIYSPYSTGGEDRTMLYMGADNTLYYPNTNMTINAFRAYFKLTDGLVCGDPSTAGAKGISNFVLNFGDGETTGISNHLNNPTTKQPNDWFTLDGRRLSGKPSQKGLYIHNGNKIVIK